MPPSSYATVILPLPLDRLFTYAVPDSLADGLQPGMRVEAPFQKRWLVGIVQSITQKAPDFDVKPLGAVLDGKPLFDEALLDFLIWLSRYYMVAPGEVLMLALPPGMLAGERLLVALTGRGRALLQGLPLPPGENAPLPSESKNWMKKLALLPLTGEVMFSAFQKKARPLSRSMLRQWETAELVKVSISQPGSGLREKRVTILRTALDEPDGLCALARAPKQAEIYSRLCRCGAMERSAFVKGDAACARAVSELIKRGLIDCEEKMVYRSPLENHVLPEDEDRGQFADLWPDQQKALDVIEKALVKKEHEVFLLYGTPGSGKTEVYLRAARQSLAQGKSVLLLVPEISLTPQLATRVQRRFGGKVALLHSALSAGERYDEWRRILSGEARLVVGARSALFAPLCDLGLIIVDEEQDPSYKSEERVLYQARDGAVMRAKQAGIPVLLGSATPSVESIANAKAERYSMLRLARPEEIRKPKMHLIDMGLHRTSKRSLLSSELVLAIEQRLAKHEQVILFLNRRGYAPFLLCSACKRTVDCRHCSVTMPYHRTVGKLLCHHCDVRMTVPERCPHCGRDTLELHGVGTQRVEDELELTFPTARIARMDRDVSSKKGALRELLDAFGAGDIDILIGTQLVTKGHDFPNVTLVGVLSADAALHIPDFRASERAFQLLYQVAGRAGRREREGEVIVQTFQPDHPVLRYLKRLDPEGFYKEELRARKDLYPPFKKLALLRFEHEDQQRVLGAAQAFGEACRKDLERTDAFPTVLLLGPSPAPLLRIRERYRYRLLFKADNRAQLHRFVKFALQRHGALLSSIRCLVDIDPGSMG